MIEDGWETQATNAFWMFTSLGRKIIELAMNDFPASHGAAYQRQVTMLSKPSCLPVGIAIVGCQPGLALGWKYSTDKQEDSVCNFKLINDN